MAENNTNNSAYVEALLRLYNQKRAPIRKTPKEETGMSLPAPLPRGSVSYVNTYDQLYNKYKDDINFNENMWHEALAQGEQDAYLSLLDGNVGQTMSDEFYNPLYYDYSAQMMELYKNQATGGPEERFTQVYNPETGTYEQQSLGEMNERQWIDYQLKEYRNYRRQELEFEAEEIHKENLSWWVKSGHTFLATLAELGEGALSALTGMVDFVGALLVSPFLINGENATYGDAFVDYYGKYSLTALEKEHIRTAMDEWEMQLTWFKDLDGTTTQWGKWLGGLSNSIGMMIPSIVLAAITGGTSGVASAATGGLAKVAASASKWIGMASFYTAIFSSNMYENATNPLLVDSPSWLKITNAFVKTTAEAVIEYTLGKFLGGTIPNMLMGIGGRTVAKSATKALSRGAAVGFVLKSAAQEGLEEFLQDFSTNLIDQFTGTIFEGYEKTGVTFQTLIDSFVMGAAMSIMMTGGNIVANAGARLVGKSKDFYVENADGSLKRIGGARRLYMSSILNDFKTAVDTLKSGGITMDNVELAGEVYSTFSTMTQMFASWDTTRMENATKLLQRVTDLEQNLRENGIDGNVSQRRLGTDKVISDFAKEIETQLTDMMGGVGERYKERAIKAIKEKAKKLAEDGVTRVKAAIEKDGTIHTNDAKTEEQMRKLNHKWERLRKEYEWIFTTDGHVAVEQDGFLFVSEAWLENYEVSDIYKYMSQDKIIDGLLTDKDLQAMTESIHEFDKQFSNRPDLTAEQALLDFLFNKSVFEAYLLSNKGGNLFTFKKLVFNTMSFIDILAEEKGLTQEKKNYLKQIKEKVMQTWREPMMKAIVNWNLNMQEIGADYVLEERDREFIKQYEIRKTQNKNAVKASKVSSQYVEDADILLAKGKFTDAEKDYIRQGLKAPANSVERVQAVAMLNEADYRYSIKDYEITSIKGDIDNLKEDIAWLKAASKDTAIAQEQTSGVFFDITKILYDLAEFARNKEYMHFISAAEERFRQNPLDAAQIISMFSDLFGDIRSIVQEAQRYIALPEKKAERSGAFTLSEHALNDFGVVPRNFTQNKQNAINAFINLYGIDPQELLNTKSEYTYEKIAGRESFRRLYEDMLATGETDIVKFTVDKLESLLGPEYIVTPIFTGRPIGANRSVDEYAQYIVDGNELLAKFIKDKKLSNDDAVSLATILYELQPVVNDNTLHDLVNNLPVNITYENLPSTIQIETWLNMADDTVTEWKMSNSMKMGDYTIITKISAKELLKPIFMQGTLEEQRERIEALLANGSVPLAEFLNVDVTGNMKLQKMLFGSNYWIVRDTRFVDGTLGQTESGTRTISIDTSRSDVVHTLVHEINHALQFEYSISRGFNNNTTRTMTDLLTYIANTYPQLVTYVARRSFEYPVWYENAINAGREVSERDIIYAEDKFKDVLSMVAYHLVQGEIWAEEYYANETRKGFTFKAERDSDYNDLYTTYLVSPHDGEKFKIPYRMEGIKTYSVNDIPLSPTTTGILIEHDFENSLMSYAEGNVNAHNTVHAGLARLSAREVLNPILSNELSLVEKGSATIDDIIRNPAKYLSPDLLAQMQGMTEGQTYYFLRDYFERTNGVSIDRDENTHTYVLVDDKAFNNLFNRNIASLSESGTDIYDEFNGKSTGIDTFYRESELDKLGVPTNVQVELGPNVHTETIIDKANPYGKISIKTREAMSNGEIMMRLNHEFRHLLQYYNQFEAGFTPDFKITPEMRADIKKHVPNVFKIADKYYQKGTISREQWENFVIQRFFYFLTGGEQNAFGLRADLLQGKPVFVTEEAGHPTIFAPWYNPETGEGRYTTDFIANRSIDEDETGPKLKRLRESVKEDTVTIDGKTYKHKDLSTPKEKAVTETEPLPKKKERKGHMVGYLDKKPKFVSKEVDTTNPDKPKSKNYKYENQRRYFTKEEAEGTNLIYFYKKGTHNEMDRDLQEFVKATTGNESKLPKEIIHAIKRGKLTKQSLFKWFRTADLKKMDQYTFDFINKYMFKNVAISTPEELAKISYRAQLWYAAVLVLRKDSIGLEALIAQNDVNALVDYMIGLEGSKEWGDKIMAAAEKYVRGGYMTGGKWKSVNLEMEAVEEYMKTLAMENFDGSLASAFYVAQHARKAALMNYIKEQKALQLDTEIEGKKGDDQSRAVIDTLTDANKIQETMDDEIGTDIRALYEAENVTKSIDDMIEELVSNQAEKLNRKAKIAADHKLAGKSEAYKRKVIDAQVREHLMTYVRKIQRASDEQITNAYNKLREEQLTGNEENTDTSRPVRTNIVANIKGKATQLLNLVNKGKVIWDALPQDVRDMFTEEEVMVRGVKQKVKVLKPEVYSVGRGAVKGKRTFAGNQNLAHDTTKIYDNMMRLNRVVADAKNNIYASKEAAKKASQAERELQRKSKEMQKRLSNPTKKSIKEESPKRETEFKVTKRKRTSDTPNNFTIVSAREMPVVLRKIFDTSFEDMADTKVQFASKDEAGNYYDKETNEKTFNSRLKHEVNNWETFYEANRESLLALNRVEVMEIVDFVEGGATTFDGPANKVYAFQLFTLGYIVDAARRNISGWNFSEAEIDAMEQLYERIASAYGSGLNAVAQMKKVVDPYKKVRQHMLEEYNIDDYDLQPLITALDDYQGETDQAQRDEKLKEVLKMQKRIERRMMMNKALETYELSKDRKKKRVEKKYGEADNWAYLTDKDLDSMTDKEFFQKVPVLNGKSVYEKIKSMRYTFMLSSPMTWVRNVYSNVIQLGFTKASETLSNLVFKIAKKSDYREEQWDLTHTKTSPEIKKWIDQNILSNPLFNSLYDVTTKYDNRKKNVSQQKDLFVTLLTRAIEQKYAAQHRFDSRAANLVSNFVNRMLSDKRFVRFATGRYLGKILTIEAEKGTFDMSKGVTNSVLNVFADAMLLANQDYMHRRSFLADMIDSLQAKHPIAYEVLNWWQPFLNSSFNWFTEMLNYTPIGIIRGVYNMHKLEDTVKKLDAQRAKGHAAMNSRMVEYLARRHIGKGILGTLLIGLGVILGLTGVLRIDEDDEKYYMTVGDIKVDISNIFGTSSILIGAALTQFGRDANDDGEADYDVEDILGFIAEYMTEGFLLKDILDRHRWDSGIYEGMLTELESVMRSFVPQFVQLFVRAMNNQEIKYSSGFMGTLERWLNTFVVTQPFGQRKVNPYTGEIETKYAIPFIGELLKGGLFGATIYWEYTPDYEEYARGLGVNKGQLTTIDINGQEIDNFELNKKYGEFNAQTLPEIEKGRHLVKMPDGTFKTLSWDKMSDEQKANVIERTMENNATAAKAWYWTQVLNHKYYTSPTIYKLLRDLGVTQNVYRGDKGFVE